MTCACGYIEVPISAHSSTTNLVRFLPDGQLRVADNINTEGSRAWAWFQGHADPFICAGRPVFYLVSAGAFPETPTVDDWIRVRIGPDPGIGVGAPADLAATLWGVWDVISPGGGATVVAAGSRGWSPRFRFPVPADVAWAIQVTAENAILTLVLQGKSRCVCS